MTTVTLSSSDPVELAGMIVHGSLIVRGPVHLVRSLVAGDLIAEGTAPRFSNLTVAGAIYHPNRANVQGCVTGTSAPVAESRAERRRHIKRVR